MRLNEEKFTKSLSGQTQPSKENKMTLAELAAQTSKKRVSVRCPFCVVHFCSFWDELLIFVLFREHLRHPVAPFYPLVKSNVPNTCVHYPLLLPPFPLQISVCTRRSVLEMDPRESNSTLTLRTNPRLPFGVFRTRAYYRHVIHDCVWVQMHQIFFEGAVWKPMWVTRVFIRSDNCIFRSRHWRLLVFYYRLFLLDYFDILQSLRSGSTLSVDESWKVRVNSLVLLWWIGVTLPAPPPPLSQLYWYR